jgi:hypothetical protein
LGVIKWNGRWERNGKLKMNQMMMINKIKLIIIIIIIKYINIKGSSGQPPTMQSKLTTLKKCFGSGLSTPYLEKVAGHF